MPLLVALLRTASGQAASRAGGRGLRLGLLAGAVYFGGTLYWTADVMVTFGNLPRATAVPVAGLLVAYLSLYPGLCGWLLARSVAQIGVRALWLAPPVWVATEHLRGWLFTGFPWVALGYSQATVLPVAQLASIGGVAIISLLVTAVSASIVLATSTRRATDTWIAVGVIVLAGAAVAWGQARIARGDLVTSGTPLVVGVVQGNVPQAQKWDPAYARPILQRYLDLTRDVASAGAALVVWPESATPFFFEEEFTGRAAILDAARSSGAWILLGSDQVERATPRRYYNAAFLVSPEGRQTAVYRKMHLVPFGEYVPLRQVLFFAAPLVEGIGDFASGTEVTLLDIGQGRLTTAICYESVFPYLARDGVRRGSQLLTAITNDAWYGWSSAPYQHYEQGLLRAVEFGRYFVRAANTGISAIVDPYGRVVAERGLFETAAIVGEVRLLDGRTIYARIGDSVAWACVAILAGVIAVTGRPGRLRAAAPPRQSP